MTSNDTKADCDRNAWPRPTAQDFGSTNEDCIPWSYKCYFSSADICSHATNISASFQIVKKKWDSFCPF